MTIEPYSESMQPVNRLLALAIRGGLTPCERDELRILYRNVSVDATRKAARQNKVEALVLESLSRQLPDQDVNPEWKTWLAENEQRVLRFQEAWKSVAVRLDQMGCRHALVENAGVLYGSFLPLAAFSAGDFDILIADNDWEDVKQAFTAEGFVPVDRRNRPTSRIEYRRESPGGNEPIWLNVGARAFDRIWVPLKVSDRESVWLSRTCPSRKDSSLMVLSPEDALAFVSMHTSLHSYVRSPGIRLHVDIDRLVRDNPIDWDAYIAEVLAMNIPTRAFISLAMAAGLLGSPIPLNVFDKLCLDHERWQTIKQLLTEEGVFFTGKNKLKRMKAILLDYYLYEGRFCDWFGNVIYPSQEWLMNHFGRDIVSPEAYWILYCRRITKAFSMWDPK